MVVKLLKEVLKDQCGEIRRGVDESNIFWGSRNMYTRQLKKILCYPHEEYRVSRQAEVDQSGIRSPNKKRQEEYHDKMYI